MNLKKNGQLGYIHYALTLNAAVFEDWQEIPYGMFSILCQLTPAFRNWFYGTDDTFRQES